MINSLQSWRFHFALMIFLHHFAGDAFKVCLELSISLITGFCIYRYYEKICTSYLKSKFYE